MGNQIFIRLKWLLDPVRTEIWFNHKNKTRIERFPLEIGQDINLKIGDSRYCIGSESKRGVWISCLDRQRREEDPNARQAMEFVHPDDLTPGIDTNLILLDSRKFIQCYKCSTSDYFNCRMTCQGDYCNPSSNLAKQICTPPNTNVYLTYVGNEYKIGVSLSYMRRWLEQGSDLSTIIAALPGLEARQLEQIGSQDLDLKLQVRGTTKIQSLGNSDIAEAKLRLKEYAEALRPTIQKIIGSANGELIEPDVIDLSTYYGDYDRTIPINIITPDPGIEFGGSIVGIKGSIVIVKQGVYQYALDFKQLVSKSFRFLDRKAVMPTQTFLDQWF